jgi:hypothetical protein
MVLIVPRQCIDERMEEIFDRDFHGIDRSETMYR